MSKGVFSEKHDLNFEYTYEPVNIERNGVFCFICDVIHNQARNWYFHFLLRQSINLLGLASLCLSLENLDDDLLLFNKESTYDPAKENLRIQIL